LHHYSSVIQALQEENRYYDNLFTRTRELLKEYNVKFARQQFTNTLKTLTKENIILKEIQGNKTLYSLNHKKQNAISLIMKLSEGYLVIIRNQLLVEKCKQAIKKIQKSNEKNKDKKISELADSLIDLSLYVLAMLSRNSFMQIQSFASPVLVKELIKHEKETRQTLNKISMIINNLGEPYEYKFFKKLYDHTSRTMSRNYNKIKNNKFF